MLADHCLILSVRLLSIVKVKVCKVQNAWPALRSFYCEGRLVLVNKGIKLYKKVPQTVIQFHWDSMGAEK